MCLLFITIKGFNNGKAYIFNHHHEMSRDLTVLSTFSQHYFASKVSGHIGHFKSLYSSILQNSAYVKHDNHTEHLFYGRVLEICIFWNFVRFRDTLLYISGVRIDRSGYGGDNIFNLIAKIKDNQQ